LRPNETELSHRYRKRAQLAEVSVLIIESEFTRRASGCLHRLGLDLRSVALGELAKESYGAWAGFCHSHFVFDGCFAGEVKIFENVAPQVEEIFAASLAGTIEGD